MTFSTHRPLTYKISLFPSPLGENAFGTKTYGSSQIISYTFTSVVSLIKQTPSETVSVKMVVCCTVANVFCRVGVFKPAVGVGVPGLKYVHGTAEADFDALYKQVMGGAFLDAYESLRGANAITDIEGAKGTAAKTRLSTAQSEVEFVRAARELQSIMRKGVERAKAKAKAGAAPAAVPAAGEWGKAVAE